LSGENPDAPCAWARTVNWLRLVTDASQPPTATLRADKALALEHI